MGLIVDTSVFIQIERKKAQSSSLDVFRANSLLVSAITISELLVGAHRANTEARKSYRIETINGILVALAVLPFTLATAKVHAKILADMTAQGIAIGAHDLIIAATAIEHGHNVVTTNRRDFERVPGLEVIDFPPQLAPPPAPA